MGRTPFSFFKRLAGVLLAALLAFLCGNVASAQTITNVASASWNNGSDNFSVTSNTVTIQVVPGPVSLEIWGRPRSGAGPQISFPAPNCAGNPLLVSGAMGSSDPSVAAVPTASVRIGEIAYFRLSAPAANIDSGSIDTVSIRVTSGAGDSEELELFETGLDSGLFMAGIRTHSVPPAPVHGDCQLSVDEGDEITVAAFPKGQQIPVASAKVGVLADPYGLVFDSEDGSPVSGARISLVDAATGSPATVYADDGITLYPSTMIAGQPVTDSAGNVYAMQPGEYRFPLAPLGTYRLVVEPPAPYRAPSVVQPAQLSGLTRPDGGALIIGAGSYGQTFSLSSLAPVRIDVPVDRPAVGVTLVKSASRLSATPGDVVFYTITVTNSDPARPKRQVVLTDSSSRWLRLRKDSVRIDGVSSVGAVVVSGDGRTLTVTLGDIAPNGRRVVTYAMSVRNDALPGQAVNRVIATDARGNESLASASVQIERETIAGRMTIIGRITGGDCTVKRDRPGLAGVRVMLEDGSYAITDADGRYHFEGVVPGTHVVQAQAVTLVAGGRFVDCSNSSRSAGSANSKFIVGHGGSLAVADFSAIVPTARVAVSETVSPSATDQQAAGAETDWLALGDGPIDWLFPSLDHNPRAPAVRVAIRHRSGQKVELQVNGKPVDQISFDGQRGSPNGAFAVSLWRGIPLDGEITRLTATVYNADGTVAAKLSRPVHFSATPARVILVPELSRLTADGAARPIVAVRVVDRTGRPVHAGIAGQFEINAPFESAQVLDAMQSRALSGLDRAESGWVVRGDDGIALIELAPTMVSGALKLNFNFSNGEVRQRQTLEAWIVPGEQKWTLIGLAEGSIGELTVADQMERRGRFDSDLGEHARVAFYAKGRIKGRYLLTLAYDSAKQEDDQRLLGAIDPNAYYTVFADRSDRRFDAASREKLYVRIETATFYALYGDFTTGFDQTQLARYMRTTTGVKAEVQQGAFHALAFAAQMGSTHRRDEFQGAGISGPYPLSSRALLANSETVAIEVRDRFRSELTVERRTLTRFVDYDIDMLAGTITFREPILSRDFLLNPQFIVIDYEIDAVQGGPVNAGVRADYSFADGALRIGTTALTDTGSANGNSERTNLLGVDLRARLGDSTEIRAESAVSQRSGQTDEAWLIEIEYHDEKLDLLAYARSADEDFGVGQMNAAERGRRKFGFDGRYALAPGWSVSASTWIDTSLIDTSRRQAAELRSEFRSGTTDGRIGLISFRDRLVDGSSVTSTVIEGGIRQRLLGNRLELEASSSISLGNTESVDLPNRHRLSARYSLTSNIRIVGIYELASGDAIDTRSFLGGFEITPWAGGKLVTTLGQQSVGEFGRRSYAAFGLAQSLPISANLTIDATLDGSRTIGGFDASQLINVQHPASSGGLLGSGTTLTEDFTAATLGGTLRDGDWAATVRGEYRKGELADRHGVTFGLIRQFGDGAMLGTGVTWTRAKSEIGATSQVIDAALAFAYRPDNSEFAALGKVEYRGDTVSGAIAGTTGPEGRTALSVTGDAESRRLLGSLSVNWSPFSKNGAAWYKRSEFGMFLGVRHSFDRLDETDLAGTTLMGGFDGRIGIGERFEVGASATVRHGLADNSTSFAFGPVIGFVPAKDTLLTIGYNVTGYRDRDFADARRTERGAFIALRLKFDADSFGFLGLGK